MTERLKIKQVTTHVFRYPLATAVQTSFGIMRDRPMLVIEAEDEHGVRGFGEVWCNFPPVGAEHRARLVRSVLAPLVTSRQYDGPSEAFEHLTRATEVLALQSAEPGPFAQAIAGIDIALWDLASRSAGEPLWRYINPRSSPDVAVYASGLNPDAPEVLAANKRAEGYTAFKQKIGFGLDRDLRNLEAVRTAIGDESHLMVDANQAWDLGTALHSVESLHAIALDWLEEPLRCDRPWSEWRTLADHSRIPLAAGENIQGVDAFDTALNSNSLRVLQPDIAKWGGFSAAVPVARAIRKAGARFCPHYLGGGIGLLASAHLLAAVGGDGLLEIDANPNPLRTELCGPLNTVALGVARLTNTPGLGLEPDFRMLNDFLVAVQP